MTRARLDPNRMSRDRRTTVIHRKRFAPAARTRGLALGTALATLATVLALAGCVRDEQPLTGDNTGTQTPQPPGSSPPTTPPPSGTPPPDNTPPPVDPGMPTATPPTTDVAAFEQTLYPLVRDAQNFCVGCHGATQIPTFAVADVTTAYNVITTQQKVNLVNPELSRVYLRPAVDRHNCGGNATCDRIAADFLAAIQRWAQIRPATAPPMQQALMSAVTTFSQGMGSGNGRADANAVAVFTFDEGAGTTTADKTGAITLNITGMEWVQGGLKNVSGKAQANATDSRKLFDAINPAGQFSVEAWIIPDNLTQSGPARIVSYSSSTSVRNFMLGQDTADYRGRARTSVSNANGDPQLDGANPDVATALQHVVLTFDPTVGRKLYVNGQLSAQETAPATLAWTNDQTFVIGNEVTDDRLWKGTFELVAIHKKALSAAEVQQNFAAGAGGFVTLSFDVSTIVGAQARVDLLAAPIDAKSYVFAKPTFVGPSGTRVKNIRIAVNDTVPVAAQTFRRLDTTVPATGTELSPLGAVIPAALGPDADKFHLEFEALGTKFGLAETVPPSSPPTPAADVPEPALGVRSFSKLNDTMSLLTGVSVSDTAVQTLYADVRDSLPATDDVLAFGATQQVAIQRFATTYCGEVVTNATACSGFFGACTIGATTKDQIADTVYDKLLGTNLANQPDKTAVHAELVKMMNDLGCTNGCTGATAQTALQATCAATLSSAAVTLN
jgi:hypothetical protein